jgi:hypothetical protein
MIAEFRLQQSAFMIKSFGGNLRLRCTLTPAAFQAEGDS